MAWIGMSVGLGVLTLLLLVVLVVRWRRVANADERVADVVASLNERMDELGRELASALDRAEEEGRRSRIFGELSDTIELDEVLARTLEAAESLERADAALVMLPEHEEGKPVVATLGLSLEEAERHAVTGPPDGRLARSITMTYTYPRAEPGIGQNGGQNGASAERVDDLIHAGLAVPMPGTAGTVGYIAIFTREADRQFSEEDVAELELLAVRAGHAIENARRFREARQLADLDALTGLHNRRFFHETLSREVSRAHRYNRRLALIVFDLDDFKEVNDKIGHLAGDSVLAETADRVRGVVRAADIACRVGGDEFAIMLPEAGIEEADQLYRRIQSAVAGRPIPPAGRLFLSAGVAELRPEDDVVSFFQRADDALYRAKDAGKGRVVTASAARPVA
ncbi:MAG TPA: sensor domain-containing diguanylate cyclase [Gaiellaceae bacterium]|jgi:diguanylate cyclase (GGDEF)-like protein|nr:sensor domain-containing diguanylate cyclase [Gaiellaceae bacterium]